MEISNNDREILRKLAGEHAEIATLSAHKENTELWKNLNSMKSILPLVWINEIPWHEMNVNDELTLRCEGEFSQQIETQFRKQNYQWNHMRGNMIIEPFFQMKNVIYDTGFGIDELVEIAKTDENNGVVSREFTPQIKELEDVEKIKMPKVSLDKEATEERFQALSGAFGDVLPVKKSGVTHQWFTLWDNLIRWYGVEEAMLDLILKPEVIHAALERLLQAFLHRLKQYEELNLLSLDNDTTRVGSGGYGCIDELPSTGFDAERVRPIDQWGCGNAQVFSDVSPAMHEEFSLQYERRWLERFGLTYYGCCEPLHNKFEILKSVPNLRKISMSPWADVGKTVEMAGDSYVLSFKVNPAILAHDRWNPQQARKEMKEVLEKTEGCSVEIIMKDISTLRYEPQRLWEMADIAMELTGQSAIL